MRGKRLATWPLLCALLLSACASLPTEKPGWIRKLEQHGAGRVSEPALREAVGDSPATLDFARRMAAVQAALTHRGLIGGNRVTLLVDADATHAAQLAAIAQAKHHIDLDVYILADDDVGRRYARALIAKARAGVKVRLMYDSVGALGIDGGFLDELLDAGVELFEYNSVNPFKEPRLWRINRRNHWKLLVVDGRVAFTGGINVSADEDGSASAHGSRGSRGWRDTHVRIDGPAVAAFESAFMEAWERNVGPIPDLHSAAYYPPLQNVGDDLVGLATNRGADLLSLMWPLAEPMPDEALHQRQARHAIYRSYLAAIREARERVWVTQAYFVPNHSLVKALKDAAARGVDVRLLMPGVSDVGLTLAASQHYYKGLLKAGIRIYEYTPAVIHAKTAVIDGVWATVGSSNLDYRSFIHNDEANAIVIGRDFGAQMEKLFLLDLEQSREIGLEAWKRRGFWQKSKEFGAMLVKYWL